VLLGDAAHTMSPVLGQGLNSSLEDVAVFAQCLEQHEGNVHAALPAYNRARLPAIQALLTLNEAAAASDLGLQAQVFSIRALVYTHMFSANSCHTRRADSESVSQPHRFNCEKVSYCCCYYLFICISCGVR